MLGCTDPKGLLLEGCVVGCVELTGLLVEDGLLVGGGMVGCGVGARAGADG